jgi:hypothetical protein
MIGPGFAAEAAKPLVLFALVVALILVAIGVGIGCLL